MSNKEKGSSEIKGLAKQKESKIKKKKGPRDEASKKVKIPRGKKIKQSTAPVYNEMEYIPVRSEDTIMALKQMLQENIMLPTDKEREWFYKWVRRWSSRMYTELDYQIGQRGEEEVAKRVWEVWEELTKCISWHYASDEMREDDYLRFTQLLLGRPLTMEESKEIGALIEETVGF